MMTRGLVAVLRAYRYLVSPLLAPRCRFYPSCSAYTIEAIEQHGLYAGMALSMRRLARCHPWHPGGIDAVPQPSDTKTAKGLDSS